jgi:hypothetical protein
VKFPSALIFAFACLLGGVFHFSSFANGVDKPTKLVEVDDKTIRKEVYDSKGILVESVTFNKKTLRPHGERRIFNPDGSVKTSKWFIDGKEADQKAFEEYSKNEPLTGPFSPNHASESDVKLFSLVENLSKAWSFKNHKACKSLIEEAFAKDQDKIPAHLLNAGFLWYGEGSGQQASKELDSALNLLEKIDPKRVENSDAYTMVKTLVKNYSQAITKAQAEGKSAQQLGVVSEHLMPFSELVNLYAKAIGLKFQKSLKEAGVEYDKLSNQEKAKMAADVEEAIKKHPTKKISYEEYMKERSAPPTHPGDIALLKELRAYSRKASDLYLKYPNKGEVCEKALLELKAEHEKKRTEIKKKFFPDEKS